MPSISPPIKILFSLIGLLSILIINGFFPFRQSVNADQPFIKSLVAQGEFNNSQSLNTLKNSSTPPDSAQLISTVSKDLNISSSDALRLDFIKVPQGKQTLFVIKAPPRFCGAAGCLFLGYLNTKKVLSIYLVDRLPVGFNTLISSKDDRCITVHSMRSYGSRSIVTKDFCFQGDHYLPLMLKS